MRKAITLLLAAMLTVTLATGTQAAMPKVGEEQWITPVQALEEHTSSGADTAPSTLGEAYGNYTDAELNMIANVVNGEVGGIGSAAVTLTYADGSQLWTDGYTLRLIHARIVDNQVRSSLFPSTVKNCVGQCWSWDYTGTGWRDSAQWQTCREAVVNALNGGISVPENVFAATCDAVFASYYPGWRLWARVNWNTGWYSGTFYYYQYG